MSGCKRRSPELCGPRKTLGGALSSVIEELARVSGASVERIAWSLLGKLLTSPDDAAHGRVGTTQ